MVIHSLYFYLTKYNFKCKNQKLILELIFTKEAPYSKKSFLNLEVKMKESKK